MILREHNYMETKERPPGSRMERKKEETKLKIITAAMKLFKKYGFDETTMELIANEADIAKGTLYNYFPVKEAILGDFIKRSFSEKNPARIEQLKKLPDMRTRMILILSELTEGVMAQKEIFEKLSKTQPIGRMGKPEEVADLALYLCSDSAGFITGTNFPIDGGFIKLNS